MMRNTNSWIRSSSLLLRLLLLVLLAVPPSFVNATGKGPVGIYAINHRYVLVSDSNFDALFVVDVERGYGIVAKIRLHRRGVDPPNGARDGEGGDKRMKVTKNWVDPTGIVSCDKCRYIYFTSQKDPNVGYIELRRPLLEMARDGNFDELTDASVSDEPTWKPIWTYMQPDIRSLLRKDGISEAAFEQFKPSKFRMIEMHRDGQRGYLSHYDLGVFSFSLSMDEGGKFSNITHFLSMKGLGASSISGLTLSPDETRLVITAKSSAYIADVSDRTIAPIILERINLQRLCGVKLRNGKYLDMNFRDAVWGTTQEHIVAVGKPYGNSGTTDVGYGAVLFLLSKHSSIGTDSAYNECKAVANKLGNGRGWRDGTGEQVRFTRPHAMIRLPQSDASEGTGSHVADALILTDIDNRAVRRVDLLDITGGDIRISTVPYDERTWIGMYGNSSSLVNLRGSYSAGYTVRIANSSKQLAKKLNAPKSTANTEITEKRLCSIEELRDFKHLSNIVKPGDGFQAWTLNRCKGCWLHFPGYCREGEGWDGEYQMVAHLSVPEDDGEMLSIRAECTHRNTTVNSNSRLIFCEEMPSEQEEGAADIERP